MGCGVSVFGGGVLGLGRSKGCGGGREYDDDAVRIGGRFGEGATISLSEEGCLMSPVEEAVIIADCCGSLRDTVEATGVLKGS